MTDTANPAPDAPEEGETRRDFLLITTATVGAVGAALAAWPFIDSMNPAADTLAMASTSVDLSAVEVGQAITVIWRGKPVFIRHRTEKEIEEARSVDVAALTDPQPDAERVSATNGWSWSGSARIWAVFPSAEAERSQGRFRWAGSAPATVRTTIPRAVSARVPHR